MLEESAKDSVGDLGKSGYIQQGVLVTVDELEHGIGHKVNVETLVAKVEGVIVEILVTKKTC